jgi:hypothetical protein
VYLLTESSNWEPDFESLEKLDLSKVMWDRYPYTTRAREEV